MHGNMIDKSELELHYINNKKKSTCLLHHVMLLRDIS